MQWFKSHRACSTRRLLTGVFLFLCLFSAIGHAGLVLCIGDCGVSQIESALDGCCAHAEFESTPARDGNFPPLAVTRKSDDCGQCVDIPLVSPSFNSPAVRSAAADCQSGVAVSSLPYAAPAVDASIKPHVHTALHARNALTSTLRSTIILI